MIKREQGQSGYMLSIDSENKPLVYNLKVWSPSVGVSLFFSKEEAEQFINDCLKEFYNDPINEN